jgi:hypothetical protein
MTPYSRFQQGMIGVLGGALLVTSIGCSTPLSTREKGALVGGGAGAGVGALIAGWPGAAIGGALGAGGGALVGDQLQKRDRQQEGQARELTERDREIRRQHQEIERLKQQQDE